MNDNTPQIKIKWYNRVLFYVQWVVYLAAVAFLIGVVAKGLYTVYLIGWNLW